MTHELKTPINGILASVDVLARSHLDTPQTEYLGYIKLCSDSLLDLITDILDFSKVKRKFLPVDYLLFVD